MHTRCYGTLDDAPVPDAFMCDACTAAAKHHGTADDAHAHAAAADSGAGGV